MQKSNQEKANAPYKKLKLATTAAVIVFAAVAIVGCSVSGAGSQFAQLKQIQCPDKPPATYIGEDVSGTARSPQLLEQRLAIIRSVLTRTSVCGGQARVLAFSGSATASEVLLDQDLATQGATRNARLRRVPAAVDDAVQTVDQQTKAAIKSLPADGTDVLSQLTLAKEYATGVGTGHSVEIFILSDGISTTNPILNTNTLTSAVATDLGERVQVPTFRSGTAITFAGIGRVAGPPPPTWFVDAIKTFWNTACTRTNARCSVATDYTQRS